MKDPGDQLATTVYRILDEGEKGGWVSCLPPDAAPRLNEAVNAFCVPDGDGPRVPPARQITRAIRDLAKSQVPEHAKVMYGVADFIAAKFDPDHAGGMPPWAQPR